VPVFSSKPALKTPTSGYATAFRDLLKLQKKWHSAACNVLKSARWVCATLNSCYNSGITSAGDPTSHDRFRQIFLDHWHRWRDLRLEDKVPPEQRA